MKHILVLGATGMIGSQVTRTLVGLGYSITAACRNPEKARATFETLCVPLNFDDPAFISALCSSESVINLCGSPVIGRFTQQHKQQMADSRVGITKSLVSAVEQYHSGLNVLINASAIGVYGSHTVTDEVLTEKAPVSSDDYLARLCGEWEGAAHSKHIKRIVMVRTGLVLSDQPGSTLSKLVLPFRLGVGGTIGIRNSWRSWIHIADEVGIIMHALTNDSISGALNATAPNPVTARQLAAALSQATHLPNWLTVPEIAVRAGLGEAAEIITRGKKVIPSKAMETGYQFYYSQIEAALQDLL